MADWTRLLEGRFGRQSHGTRRQRVVSFTLQPPAALARSQTGSGPSAVQGEGHLGKRSYEAVRSWVGQCGRRSRLPHEATEEQQRDRSNQGLEECLDKLVAIYT